MTIELTGIRRYPVKSFRGEDLEEAVVEPWGLEDDRRWMVIGDDREAITAREVHRMLTVVPELLDDGIRLNAPGAEPIEVPVPDVEPINVTVHGGPVPGMPAGRDADAWVSEVLGVDARLIYLDDPYSRPTKAQYSEPGDVVSFADAFPVLLATEDSLAMLNDWIAEGPRSDEGPLSMTRFRPNLIVRGAPAFDEDTWARIRVGDAVFRVVKDCDRCVLTTLDPVTGDKQMEPIATLARHRKWDGKTWFAVNLIPDTPDARVRVGDEVEVLERRTAGWAAA
jgi:uncharacterized protein YcbX